MDELDKAEAEARAAAEAGIDVPPYPHDGPASFRGGIVMPTTAEAGLTRDALVWRLVKAISTAEGKSIGVAEVQLDRDYVLDLVRDVTKAVEGNRGPTMKIDQAALSRI